MTKKNTTVNKNFLPRHIEFARDLRKRQTSSEKIVWELLRKKKFMGLKFLRQHPILLNQQNGKSSFYIADFYCAEKNFVLEIDGLIHSFQIEYDQTKNKIFMEMGIKILRVTNDEVNENPYAVLEKIREMLI